MIIQRMRKTRRQPALARLRLGLAACVWVACVWAGGGCLQAQDQTSRFVYDDKGRLRAVIAPNGEAAVYEYDAAGNFTAIRRVAGNYLELFSFAPHQGVPGDTVTFVGTGFGAGVNSVSFNGATAQVVNFTQTMIVALVPAGVTTGPVTIVTANGTVVTPVPFEVRGVSLSPATATVLQSNTVQFAATVIPSGGGVQWSVNGGSITTTGLYTAPNLPANLPQAVFIIRATSVTTPELFGEAQVTVRNPQFVNVAISAGVLIQKNTTDAPPLQPAISAGVLVQKNTTDAPPLQPAIGAGVSVTKAPHITSLTPGTLAAGATAGVTINGANFSGTTALRFLKSDGTLDAGIVVSNLSVNAGGTVLTATLTVNSTAATGVRIALITAPTGMSQAVNLGVNTINITAAATSGKTKPKQP